MVARTAAEPGSACARSRRRGRIDRRALPFSAMGDTPDLLVSDQDRDHVAEELRDHFAAGRLTEDELDERVTAVYEARTAGELQAVRGDLPELPPTRAQQRHELAQRRSELQRRLIQQTAGAFAPFVLCTGIWVASGATGSFWPIWLALFPVIALLANGWRLYGPAPEFDRVDEEISQHERRARPRVGTSEQRRDHIDRT